MAPPDTTPAGLLERDDIAAPEWRLSGEIAHADAEARMRERAAAIAAGTAPELVWLLEHPPTLTAGTSADAADLLDARGIDIRRTGRGGQWTYHGPGQLVGYVMLDLARPHGSVPPRDVRAYVRGLERWLVATLDRLGVPGQTRPGRVGIWVVDPATGTESKIAAIGVRVTRWVTWHGIALNVSTDLAAFARIVPCGIAEHGVTSLAALGRPTAMATVASALRAAWTGVF